MHLLIVANPRHKCPWSSEFSRIHLWLVTSQLLLMIGKVKARNQQSLKKTWNNILETSETRWDKKGVLKFECVLTLLLAIILQFFLVTLGPKEDLDDSNSLRQVLNLQSQQMTRQRWHRPQSIGLDKQVLKRCTLEMQESQAKMILNDIHHGISFFLHRVLLHSWKQIKAENNCLNLRTCEYLIQKHGPEHLKHSALRSNHCESLCMQRIGTDASMAWPCWLLGT